MLGQLLDGRYRIERELGAGGFGKTYLAQDTQVSGTPNCVVKQLQPRSTEPHLLKIANRLFQQEAEVLQKLGKHGQIPSLLRYFESDQEFFLVQEFINGSDLVEEVTIGRKWSEAEAKALLEEVLAPLAIAHQEKVIHRDIKPANLMRRNSDGRIFLIDFGAVKQVAVTQVNHLKQSTTVGIGTDGYMPIEQRLGKPHLGGSDIYALGIVILQALTGSQDAASLMDADTAQVKWRHLATVSPAFAEILDKMVTNGVVNRYQSAMEVIEALKLPVAATRIGQPVANRTGSTTTMVQSPPAFKVGVGLRLWLGLLAWTAIVGSVIWVWNKNLPKSAIEPVALTPTESSTPSPAPSPSASPSQFPTDIPIPIASGIPTPSSLAWATANLPSDIPTSYLPSNIPVPNSAGAANTILPNPNMSAGLSLYPSSIAATPRAVLTAPSIASNVPQLNQSAKQKRLRTATANNELTATPQVQQSAVDDDIFNSLPNSDLSSPSTASNSPRSSRSSSTPNSNRVAPELFASQAIDVEKYFQRRWRADPNGQEALQYKLQVGQDGRVLTIEGQSNSSRDYLSRTNFVKPGTLIAEGNYNQAQKILLVLATNGSVDVLVDDSP
jgi:serine/threonine protein kinase